MRRSILRPCACLAHRAAPRDEIATRSRLRRRLRRLYRRVLLLLLLGLRLRLRLLLRLLLIGLRLWLRRDWLRPFRRRAGADRAATLRIAASRKNAARLSYA